MKTSIVMTILGADRPGLVESIAQVVTSHDANWLECRMAHMAGQFAGILRIEVAEDRATALADALRSLGVRSLELVVQADATPRLAPDAPIVCLDLVGQDRPGIVREITHVVAAAGANVEEFATECSAAPTTGQSLFRATARLRLAPGSTSLQLRNSLEQLAVDMMVDISLHEEST